MRGPPLVERADAPAARAALDDLAALLKEAVDEGAGVSFLPPFSLADARAYWEGVLPDVASGERVLLLARADGRVVGTGMLDRARVPNGRHRAEVQKMLVARAYRRRGIGARILVEAERAARELGLVLLVLDTGDENAGAQRLYEAAGYARVGVVPRYWLTAGGTLAGTVLYCKVLDG